MYEKQTRYCDFKDRLENIRNDNKKQFTINARSYIRNGRHEHNSDPHLDIL